MGKLVEAGGEDWHGQSPPLCHARWANWGPLNIATHKFLETLRQQSQRCNRSFN